MPGLLAAVAVAVVARLASRALPGPLANLDEVVIAVALGLAVAGFGLPERLGPGLRLASTTLLRIGIVLLGVRLSLPEIGRLGARTALVIVALMCLAAVVVLLASRVTSLDARERALVAVGTAVCGNSAIAASAPTIGASDEQVARAVAANTLVGTVALFAYPAIGHAVGVDGAAFGSWAGAAINDTAQVVAAGFAYGEVAGEVAVTVKLVRNALMAPALVVLALVFARRGGQRLTPQGVRRAVPGFLVAFLAVAAANSLGLTDAAADWLGWPVESLALDASRALVLTALAAVGLSTPPSSFRRGGVQMGLVALAAGLAVAVVSFALMVGLGLGA